MMCVCEGVRPSEEPLFWVKGKKAWRWPKQKDRAEEERMAAVQVYVLVLPLGQTESELLFLRSLARWRTECGPGAARWRSEEGETESKA